jgi:hypothetical protein
MASVSRSVFALASFPESEAPMRASRGGPPNRKNSVNGTTESHSKKDLVMAKAVLSPSTGVTIAGLPLTTVLPWASCPARAATASTRSNISRRGFSRGSILRMVCGARANHSLAGVQTALIATAAAANTTMRTTATASPRRRCQLCSLSTAGVSNIARNSATATGMNTSCAKYSSVPTANIDSRMIALRRVVSARGVGVLTRTLSAIC